MSIQEGYRYYKEGDYQKAAEICEKYWILMKIIQKSGTSWESALQNWSNMILLIPVIRILSY